MFEPHLSHLVVRAETMTAADRRLADEQAGRLAALLWQLARAAMGQTRLADLLGPPVPTIDT